MGWPSDFDARLAGEVCRFCSEGRLTESRSGVRILATDDTDTYLKRQALVRGYAVVVWRGRHVVEPHHLKADEAVRYFADVLRVGRAIEEHFQPLKMNYMTMGNQGPHLHTHVTARYVDDPAPGAPLPADISRSLPEPQWRDDAAALQAHLASGQPASGHLHQSGNDGWR